MHYNLNNIFIAIACLFIVLVFNDMNPIQEPPKAARSVTLRIQTVTFVYNF